MHEGDNSFWDELKKNLFPLQFKSYSDIYASTEVLSHWAVETLGDLQSTSRGLDPGFKM
jgi:hypothetical protein